MGIGGTTEGVISAAAIQCIGGGIQCKAWPRDDNERTIALAAGVDMDKVYKAEDLIDSDDVFFAATGVSSGELLKGYVILPEGHRLSLWRCAAVLALSLDRFLA